MTPLLALPFEAAAVAPARRIARFADPVTGTRVAPASANTDALLGVFQREEGRVGDIVDVVVQGQALVDLGGTVTTGAPLTTDALGRAIAAVPVPSVAVRLVGFALEAGVAGDAVRLLVQPGLLDLSTAAAPVGVAPTVSTAASVSAVDGGSTVTYTFTPATFAGTPVPTVTRVLMLDGVDVTAGMSGNVYVVTKTGATQALVMTYTATNGVSPNATSSASATVPAAAGGFALASVPEVIAYNDSLFPVAPFALSRPAAVVGGSNFDYSSATAPTPVEQRMAALLTSTFSSPALGGATNPEVATQFDTLLAGPNFDTGDILGASLTSNGYNPDTQFPAQLAANAYFATSANTIWTHSCNGDNVTQQQKDWIEQTFGASRLIDWVRIFQRPMTDPAAPAAAVTTARRGRVQSVRYTPPFDLDDGSGNSSHPGDTGQLILSREWLRAFRAADGTGAPYLHGQEMLLSSEMAAGAAVGTVNRLGTVTSWEIVGGNADGIVSIDSGGVIRRTAASLSGFDGEREIYVRATNANGSHAAMILLMDGGGVNFGTGPAARLTAHINRLMPSYSAAATMNNRLTIAMRYRVPGTNTNEVEVLGTRSPSGWGLSNGQLRLRTGGGIRFTVKNNVGGTVLNWPGTSLGGSLVSTAWTTLLVSIDNSVAGTVTRVARYLQANGTSTPLSSNPASQTTADTSSNPFMGDWYFGNPSLGVVDTDLIDIDYIWVGEGYADWTLPANRALFFDDLTGRLPSGFPADGAIAGFTPRLFLAGGCGAFLTGPNLAPGGTTTHRLARMPQISKALSAGGRAP